MKKSQMTLKEAFSVNHAVLAENVKRKDLVFALLNWEVIAAMWRELMNTNE